MNLFILVLQRPRSTWVHLLGGLSGLLNQRDAASCPHLLQQDTQACLGCRIAPAPWHAWKLPCAACKRPSHPAAAEHACKACPVVAQISNAARTSRRSAAKAEFQQSHLWKLGRCKFIYVLLLSAASWLTTGGRDEPCPGRTSPLACPDPDNLHPSSFRAYACSMLNTLDPPPPAIQVVWQA